MADFEDLFTGTLDTNLTDHTPDVGTAWTGGGTTDDNARLNGNGELKAESNEAAHAILADDLGSPDHQVWCELHGNTQLNSRVTARHSDVDDYGLGVAAFSLTQLYVSYRSGGSTNQLATPDHGLSYPLWVKLKCEGDDVSVYVSQNEPASPEDDTNWTLVNSWTVSHNNTVQTPGLQLFGSSAGDTDKDPWIDSYHASSLTTDTTAPTLTNETASADGSDGYSGSVDTDEGNGTLYHVVTQSATPPGATQVKNGNDDTGSAADASGNQAVSATGTQNVGQTGVLAASTTYYIHYMHEDSSGNQSTVASTTSFTTDSADTTAPTLSSATVDGTALTLTYNETLDTGSVPATGDFSVTGSSSGAISVSSVGVSGTDVNLTLASAVAVGETVTLDYTPGTNPIQDTAGNDAASLTGQSVTNNTSSDLTFGANFDSANIDEVATTITNPGTSTPTVDLVPRTVSGQWRHFLLRLDNANNKRPTFTVDDTNYADTTIGDGVGNWRPWYTYDNPNVADATWNRWDSDPSYSDPTYTFQLSTAFTQDTVYVAFEPIYPVARGKSLIDWLVANHPDKIHRIPSVGDSAEWSVGTMSSQTDENGRTIPALEVRGFGIWDSTTYPSDNLPKRTVVIASGQHAGEHAASHMMEGFVRFLVGGSAEATRLLTNFQFFVYPVLNVDGRWGGSPRWSFENTSADPNDDFDTKSLEMTQISTAAFAKDFDGRKVVTMMDFHADPFTTGNGTEIAFVYHTNHMTTTQKNASETAIGAEGGYGFTQFTNDDGIQWYFVNTYSTPHSHVIEHMTNEPLTAYSELTAVGEDMARAIDNLWSNEQTGTIVYAGNYIAETLNGSATVSRQLDAAVYPWPPKPADTPVKVERGLGADSSRNFRMDMGGTTGEVFVVLSSVDYESVNSDAAAGANKVTVSST